MKNLKLDLLIKLKHLALDRSPMGLIILEASDFSCVYHNTSAQESLQFEDADQFDVKQLCCDRAREGMIPFDLKLLKNNGVYSNVMMKTFSGNMIIANLALEVQFEEGRNYLVISIQDVSRQLKMQRDLTEREEAIRLAYQELLEQNEKLKELDKSKDKFIGLMTHELRTPLSAVIATIDYLKSGFYDSKEELVELVNMASEQGAHLLSLVNDIMDYSKLSANKMDFYIKQAKVNEVLQASLKAFQPSAEKSGIEIHFDNVSEDALAFFDPIRLRQVLDNVIGNAIKYNKEKGQVYIRTEVTSNQVRVSVEDTGKGIAEKDLERVFNEFETLGQMSKHQNGTGLGMPISKKLIEGMGGAIGLNSTLGKGSCFWISIPRDKVVSEELYRERPGEEDLLAS